MNWCRVKIQTYAYSFFSFNNCNQFLFEKSEQSSKQFIELVKQSELVICSDSGPLHIANALKKPVIVILNATNPEVVINSGSLVKVEARNIN